MDRIHRIPCAFSIQNINCYWSVYCEFILVKNDHTGVSQYLICWVELSGSNSVNTASVISYSVRQQHPRPWTWAPLILYASKWMKQLCCHAGCLEVSKCCTRDESEKSAVCSWQSMQVSGIHPGFETQGTRHKNLKQEYQRLYKKNLCLLTPVKKNFRCLVQSEVKRFSSREVMLVRLRLYVPYIVMLYWFWIILVQKSRSVWTKVQRSPQ